tara:strand:- start:337 stop:474 length:138 start_codon:yes stop_codon:yes gene_type:complete
METNIDKDIKMRLLEKEKNISKVVDRYLRVKLKRWIKKITGIRIK